MNICHNLECFPKHQCLVATIGAFDGVHIGHQALVKRINDLALHCAGEAVVITFDPHPRQVIQSGNGSVLFLTTIKEKITLLENAGVHHLLVLPFTRELAEMDAADFVKFYLHEQLQVKKIVVGYDHHFGKGGKGNFSLLHDLSVPYGFSVEKIDEIRIFGTTVSSTIIRNYIENGDIASANAMLGYFYGFSGSVVGGNRLGKQIGFPTANILPDWDLKLIPGRGVYAVLVDYNGQQYHGMVNIGIRPTLHLNVETIEVNIFDFSQNIYGKNLNIRFVGRLRDEMRFDNIGQLQKQLVLDKIEAQRLIAQTCS